MSAQCRQKLLKVRAHFQPSQTPKIPAKQTTKTSQQKYQTVQHSPEKLSLRSTKVSAFNRLSNVAQNKLAKVQRDGHKTSQ